MTPNGVWDVRRGKRIAPVTGDSTVAPAVDLVVAQSLTRLTLRDLATRKLVKAVSRVDYSPGQPTFSPDGRRLATTGVAGLTLYTVPELRELATMRIDARQLAFTADSQVLAVSLPDGSVRVFDAATGRPLGRGIRGFGTHLAELVFAPDRRLVGVDMTGRVVIWDALLAQTRIGPWRRRLCRLTAVNLSRSAWSRYLGTNAPWRATCPNRA